MPCASLFIIILMLKNFKDKRLVEEDKLKNASNMNLKTVEQRMKIDIQKYD